VSLFLLRLTKSIIFLVELLLKAGAVVNKLCTIGGLLGAGIEGRLFCGLTRAPRLRRRQRQFFVEVPTQLPLSEVDDKYINQADDNTQANYWNAQETAQEQRRGLWSVDKPEPIPPWVFWNGAWAKKSGVPITGAKEPFNKFLGALLTEKRCAPSLSRLEKLLKLQQFHPSN
jgi:hypothetical protein